MKKEPLDAVKMLAEMSELRKSRDVADSIVHLSAARQRLAQLEDYLDEYSGEPGDELTDIERLKSQRTFISALTQAIGDQAASIEQSRAALEQRIASWRDARANTKAVGKLTEKRANVRRQAEERIEEAELDAAGQRQRN